VVLTGNLGPNAFDVLQAAGVPGYLIAEGTIRQAVEAYVAGQRDPMAGANVAAHAGMRGSGRRMPSADQAQTTPSTVREAELAGLRETLKSLRQQLAETMEKIEKLERES